LAKRPVAPTERIDGEDSEVLNDVIRVPADENEDEDLSAVREALAEWRAGDPGLPLDATFDQVRHPEFSD
jgi:hypothetical protein